MKPYGTQIYNVTAALPYANGPIHIGHLAGVYLPADIYARYLRLRGHKVLFISGSDEGGVAILLQARKKGITPHMIIDKYHQENKVAFKKFGISFDAFERTSSPLHHKVAKEFFTALHKKGVFYTKSEKQLYDAVEKTFLADRYVQGTCPYCKFQEAYGDQCESCGKDLSPQELLNPRSKISNTKPMLKKTTHWYFPLEKYESWLQAWIQNKAKTWKNNVRAQCKAWLVQGLKSRAITRDLNWGVPLPLKQAPDKVLYVWFEALIGYISATQAWAKRTKQDWRTFWQSPKTQLVQFIGKDNIVFHCLLFPSMLQAHGGYILPTFVCSHEFMNLESRKISTSRNHAVWLQNYLQDYPGKEDVLRYVLAANMPETKDSNFHWDEFKKRNNQELVSTLSNFVYRVLVLLKKHFHSQVPQPDTLLTEDRQIMHTMPQIVSKIGHAIENFKFKQGLEHMIKIARIGNKYLADMAPWHLINKDKKRTGTILYIAAQLLGHIALYAQPYLPFTTKKLAQILNIKKNTWDDNYIFEHIPVGTTIQPPHMLFRVLD